MYAAKRRLRSTSDRLLHSRADTLIWRGAGRETQAVSTIDQISIDMGDTGVNQGVGANGIPALVDDDFNGAETRRSRQVPFRHHGMGAKLGTGRRGGWR